MVEHIIKQAFALLANRTGGFARLVRCQLRARSRTTIMSVIQPLCEPCGVRRPKCVIRSGARTKTKS